MSAVPESNPQPAAAPLATELAPSNAPVTTSNNAAANAASTALPDAKNQPNPQTGTQKPAAPTLSTSQQIDALIKSNADARNIIAATEARMGGLNPQSEAYAENHDKKTRAGIRIGLNYDKLSTLQTQLETEIRRGIESGDTRVPKNLNILHRLNEEFDLQKPTIAAAPIQYAEALEHAEKTVKAYQQQLEKLQSVEPTEAIKRTIAETQRNIAESTERLEALREPAAKGAPTNLVEEPSKAPEKTAGTEQKPQGRTAPVEAARGTAQPEWHERTQPMPVQETPWHERTQPISVKPELTTEQKAQIALDKSRPLHNPMPPVHAETAGQAAAAQTTIEQTAAAGKAAQATHGTATAFPKQIPLAERTVFGMKVGGGTPPFGPTFTSPPTVGGVVANSLTLATMGLTISEGNRLREAGDPRGAAKLAGRTSGALTPILVGTAVGNLPGLVLGAIAAPFAGWAGQELADHNMPEIPDPILAEKARIQTQVKAEVKNSAGAVKPISEEDLSKLAPQHKANADKTAAAPTQKPEPTAKLPAHWAPGTPLGTALKERGSDFNPKYQAEIRTLIDKTPGDLTAQKATILKQLRAKDINPEQKNKLTDALQIVTGAAGIQRETAAAKPIHTVESGEAMTDIAQAQTNEMRALRKAVKEALGTKASNRDVLNVLAIALAKESGIENIDKVRTGQKIQDVSKDAIKDIVGTLKGCGLVSESGSISPGFIPREVTKLLNCGPQK